MIKNIESLKGYGIFRDYKNSDVQDFGKYNLFYGWNGSGKSTLSDIFRSLECKSVSKHFPNGEFKIKLDDGSDLNNGSALNNSLNIYTFNKDFISENISWDSVVKSILIVDKEKIAEREKLEKLKKNQEVDAATHNKEAGEIERLKNEVSKFETDSAKLIRSSLQSIDTSDRYYLNYNKTKFERLIESIEAEGNEPEVLDSSSVTELTKAARPDHKPNLVFNMSLMEGSVFVKAKERLEDLLSTSVVSQIIARLADNNGISSWVEAGLDLHERHQTRKCEFCGGQLTDERKKQLEDHFNDNYKSFQERLKKAEQWLSNQYVREPQLPLEAAIYDEFKSDLRQESEALKKAVAVLNGEIKSWYEVLGEKIKNPLETKFSVEHIHGESITAYNTAMTAIEALVKKHNHKSDNFKEETNKAKKSLEIHFTVTEVKEFGYQDKKEDIDRREKNNANLKSLMDKRRSEIVAVESSLSNEGLGANQFNKSLHKFLGRKELTLRFNPSKKGYEILRNETDIVRGKLSEGEKTAIAFVYFITKLRENDNKMEETIVVLDDPVSSFDSNHLFHAYSFLRNNCEQAKQLFVLTHNFTYFKLVRDWFEKNNKNRRGKGRDPQAFFYTVETFEMSSDQKRFSEIKNADDSLVKYNSEYHYIFSKLYQFCEKPKLSAEDALLTANMARKLLESFFSFKYPKHRSDVSQLMKQGLKGCVKTDELIKERIYRFINKYSHSIVIEVDHDSSDNLMGESHNVLKDIFNWLQEVDEHHYNEMVEVVLL